MIYRVQARQRVLSRKLRGEASLRSLARIPRRRRVPVRGGQSHVGQPYAVLLFCGARTGAEPHRTLREPAPV